MEIGAIIAAAGMSSRMEDFKPMMNIGSISIAQRVVATLQQAGVSRIVMVTGYQADMLERHLSNHGLIFLRNENYENTQMFDSAKIGMEYLENKCDKVLFTPVDIPLFTASTVMRLMQSDALLSVPVCKNQQGHPILIASELIKSIVNDSGEGGLQGVIDRLQIPVQQVEVNDPGTLHDADTPQDYKKLLELHNRQLVRPVVSLALVKEITFLDEKMVMLLQLVGETHSVRKACERMQISYSTGWNLLKNLESQMEKPLIVRRQGGSGGGESSLTEEGRRLIIQYNKCLEELKSYSEYLFDKYFEINQ